MEEKKQSFFSWAYTSFVFWLIVGAYAVFNCIVFIKEYGAASSNLPFLSGMFFMSAVMAFLIINIPFFFIWLIKNRKRIKIA